MFGLMLGGGLTAVSLLDAEVPFSTLVPLAVLGGIIVVGLIVVWAMYNRLVSLRQRCRESFANIDTELQRRHDLVPNLVNIVKGYAAHERALFDRVTELRGKAMAELGRIKQRGGGGTGELAEVEGQLSAAMGDVMVVAEAYPDLKASENFRQLMRDVAHTEDRIQAARRFHNGNVRDMNSACEAFPSVVVAKWFSFKPEVFFSVDSAMVRVNPSMGGVGN